MRSFRIVHVQRAAVAQVNLGESRLEPARAVPGDIRQPRVRVGGHVDGGRRLLARLLLLGVQMIDILIVLREPLDAHELGVAPVELHQVVVVAFLD